MGHYLSEMQSDPEQTVEYKKWKKEFPPLRRKVSSIKLSSLIAQDLPDLLFVLKFSSDDQKVGGLLGRRTILPPDDADEAIKVAKRLVKKYYQE